MWLHTEHSNLRMAESKSAASVCAAAGHRDAELAQPAPGSRQPALCPGWWRASGLFATGGLLTLSSMVGFVISISLRPRIAPGP